MRELTTLEIDILLHCKQYGYKYAALNGDHVRVLHKKPYLVGTLHRYLRDDGVTVLGEALDIPGLFNGVGYGVIKLSDLSQQEQFSLKDKPRKSDVDEFEFIVSEAKATR